MTTATLIRALPALMLGAFATAQSLTPIATPIETWRPVEPGSWRLSSTRSDAKPPQAATVATSLACPYSATLFLARLAPIKLGEAGCRHSTYQLSPHSYHIATECSVLHGGSHYETTTLNVADDERHFVAVTSWSGPSGAISIRRDGEWISGCKTD